MMSEFAIFTTPYFSVESQAVVSPHIGGSGRHFPRVVMAWNCFLDFAARRLVEKSGYVLNAPCKRKDAEYGCNVVGDNVQKTASNVSYSGKWKNAHKL